MFLQQFQSIHRVKHIKNQCLRALPGRRLTQPYNRGSVPDETAENRGGQSSRINKKHTQAHLPKSRICQAAEPV